MDESEKPSISTSNWKEALYGDGLTERTQKTGRALTLVSLATLMVSVFDLSVEKIPAIPIDFSRQPAALSMFLGVLCIGLFGAYCLRLATDYLRTREESLELVTYLEGRRINNAWVEARKIDDEIYSHQYQEHQSFPEPWEEHASQITKDAKKIMKRLESKIGDRKLPKIVRNIRLMED